MVVDAHPALNTLNMLNIHILHDDNLLHPVLLEGLADAKQITCMDSYEIPENDLAENVEQLWIAVASLREHVWFDKVQRAARAQQVPVLIIGLEPGYIWLGPYVKQDESGCFTCMRRWAHNNNQQPHHWATLSDSAQTRRDCLPSSLAPTTANLFTHLLRHYLQATLDNKSANEGNSLYRQTVRLDLVNVRSSEHGFISVVDCPICADLPENSPETAAFTLKSLDKAEGSDSRVDNPHLNLESLKKAFLDRHVGLVRHVFYSLSSNLMPMFSAELPIMYTHETESGYGRSETRQNAEMVAILETLERHAGHSPKRHKTTVRGSYRELAEHALDPRAMILHEPEQLQENEFVLHPYTDDLEYNWVWCQSLFHNKQILVPEQSIFYYLLNTPDVKVNRFIYETSNGCALGGALEEAIFYGLLELVERDAYLTTWYGQFTPREIDLRSIDDDRIQALIHRVDARGLSLHAFDMRVGIDVPVVWCMIVDDADDAPVKSYCAAGAHLLPENAIYSGLIEVTTSMGVYQESMPPLKEKALEMLNDDSKVVEMHDHVLLYSLPETYERLSFLFSDEPKGTLEEIYGSDYRSKINRNITDDLNDLMDKVRDYADDVIVADLTFKELEPHQLHCVKVIAPGLMPVTFGHQYRRISLERVNKFARASGKPPFASVAELNPFPHNFP
ncbi:TOMM precursor leader peptide-binding protein [Paraneptunicella aestuarii]|uniref:TOMM precursor leader peptide-binding protein n=1 Tax=Paraneptunicella aestuarii TaxID=2831148 RepID=UPI001E4399B6|nr:TOMM precursor leader peptide-binding protein [Paraneptunicella aestuarii]UAA40053.1 TOMM precursor leader peptide-binding protein [Paraneptunicella aestuarii]